jgi:hypothetical protein
LNSSAIGSTKAIAVCTATTLIMMVCICGLLIAI